MTPIRLILLHAGLIVWFLVFVRPGICEELDETNPRHRSLGNAIFVLLLVNGGLLALNLRHFLGF